MQTIATVSAMASTASQIGFPSALLQHEPTTTSANAGLAGGVISTFGSVNQGTDQGLSSRDKHSISWDTARSELHGASSDTHTVNIDVGPICEGVPVSKIHCVCGTTGAPASSMLFPRGTIVFYTRSHTNKRLRSGNTAGGELTLFTPVTHTNQTSREEWLEGIKTITQRLQIPGFNPGIQPADSQPIGYDVNVQAPDGLLTVLGEDFTPTVTKFNGNEIHLTTTEYASIVLMGTCPMIPVVPHNTWIYARSMFTTLKPRTTGHTYANTHVSDALAGRAFTILLPLVTEDGGGRDCMWTTEESKFIVKLTPSQGDQAVTIYKC